MASHGHIDKSVGLFATCLVDLIRPQVGFATAKLISQSGFDVTVPKAQTCCGQPLFNSGDFAGTKKIALHFLEVFANFDYVVVPSGSCAATIKVHFPELFEADPQQLQRANQIAAKTYELTQFLTKVASIEIKSEFSASCTYHDSCSGYRELGIHQEPRNLLSMVKGTNITECNESTACCGFGGTFCVKYPEISARIAAEKVQNIEDTQSDAVLGGDLGCLLNIAGLLRRKGSSIKVLHVSEVLAGKGDAAGIGQ